MGERKVIILNINRNFPYAEEFNNARAVMGVWGHVYLVGDCEKRCLYNPKQILEDSFLTFDKEPEIIIKPIELIGVGRFLMDEKWLIYNYD
jgi:hypothetical protein